nr:GNAT family N-acetyltransferase [Sediminivirga luteola]
MASTWVPRESAWLHRDNAAAEASGEEREVLRGWLLRAHGGVTKRANSALLLDDPGLDLEAAIDAMTAWYEARELPPAATVLLPDEPAGSPAPQDPATPRPDAAMRPAPGAGARTAPGAPPAAAGTADDRPTEVTAPEAGGDGWAGEVDRRLEAAGFGIVAPVVVATAATAEISGGATSASALAEPHLRFAISEELPPAFLDAAAGAEAPEEERQARAALYTSAPAQYFLAALGVHPDGRTSLVGVARLAVSHRWAVLSSVKVRPDMRRRGAGRALTRAAAAHALGLGIRSIALQVEAGNQAAATLYASLGFAKHHRYHYRIRTR